LQENLALANNLKHDTPIPPRFATRLLKAFLRKDLQEEVIGDLGENFEYDLEHATPFQAKLNYWKQVFLYLRPFALRKSQRTSNNTAIMYRSYLRSATQNMMNNKMHAFINIAGLTIGISVAIIISLWIHDELSYNTQYSNFYRTGQVFQNVTNNGEVETINVVPWVLGDEIRQNYGTDFKYISMTSHAYPHGIFADSLQLTKVGIYAEADFLPMFDIIATKGTLAFDQSSILLSESTATAFYGDRDPIGKTLNMDGTTFQVTGVYKDLPEHSRFGELAFIAPWSRLIVIGGLNQMDDPWRPNSFGCFVTLNENSNFTSASERIKDARLKKVNEQLAKKKPALFIHKMEDWRLRSEFDNGMQTGGLMQYVWMFGIIGVFVLLMACINFMNLSTARSEKRAKEVGIRKAVGSYRSQLIAQFFSESILTTFISLVLSVIVAWLLLPAFNSLAGKSMTLPWNSPVLWGGVFIGSIVIGIIAGSYPALYLSSIRPVGALKGLKSGRGSSLPRKILVVVQFSVSVMMIIGTSTVFLQIQHGKERNLGYNANGLIAVPGSSPELHSHFDAIRAELIDNGSIIEMAQSVAPASEQWGTTSRIDWDGKDPELSVDFAQFAGSYDYGKTIQWDVVQGRDFSRDFPADTASVILNESAAKYLQRKDIIGSILRSRGQPLTIIGVVRNVVFANPYEDVRPSVYYLSKDQQYYLSFRLNPEKPAVESIANIEMQLKPYMTDQSFSYEFVDQSQARKFGNEERVSTLASTFAGLAIFISCLGIFGLSSFVAEQRTKEIGLRKVLGANLSQLWLLMSRDFVVLVTISCLLAAPLAWMFLQSWLESYEYRVAIPWWIFILSSIGTLAITVITSSWHMIRTARVNPAQTLKVE
jgi:putative ABC transport system permease protein